MRWKLFAKGRRSEVFISDDKKYAAKKVKQDIAAKDVIQREAKWLKYLNQYSIGPKLFKVKKDLIVMEFIDGKQILDWLADSKLGPSKKVLKKVLEKCYTLDQLSINKQEMHKPLKHVLVKKWNVVKMIDFERCYYAKKPHNVTQFCSFIISPRVAKILAKKNLVVDRKAVISAMKRYKKTYSRKDFENLLSKLKLI